MSDQDVPDDRRPRRGRADLGDQSSPGVPVGTITSIGPSTGTHREASGGAGAGKASDEDGRVSRAQRLRHERRLQVMSVALRLFAERGYHQTSIQDILDGADIARGTFYLYFDSKRAIFDELVDDYLSRIRGVVRRVELTGGPGGGPVAPPLVQIQQNLERVMAILRQNRDLTRLALRLAEGLGPAESGQDCDTKMAEFYGRLQTLLAGALENGQRMGLVRPCDARVVAQAALGSLKEVVLQWIVSRDSTEAEIEHVIQEILAFSMQGLLDDRVRDLRAAGAPQTL